MENGTTAGAFWGDVPNEVALERYRTLVNTVDDGIYQLDAEGRFVAVNDIIVEMTGYTREELIGQYVSVVLEKEDINQVVEEISRRLHGDGPRKAIFEFTAHTADGEAIPCELRISLLVEDGEFQGTIGIVRDITERKRAEQIIEKRERQRERERKLEQYRALTEAASDVIVTIDETSTIHSINQAATDVFGYSVEELMGESLTVLMPEEFIEQHNEGLQRYLETGERKLDWEYVELPGEHADGTRIRLGISFSEIRYDDEHYFTGILRDITERKEIEQELKRVRDRMEFALNATDAVVWDWNVDDDEASFYPSAESLYGMSVENWDDFLEVIHPEDRQKVQTGIEKALETGEAKSEEIRIVRDGEIRWIEAPGYPILDDDGPRRMVGVARDITERKTYEQKLKESNERLQQFAYAASHDLQEPLRMVSSYLQLIESRYADELDEAGKEFIEFAVDGADRMREMIDGLLEFSRVETEGDPFEPVDLNAALEEVLADLQFRIEEHDAEITNEELPSVEGDASQLRQLFQNLIENAIDYSGDEPRIYVSATQTGDEWVLSVRDEGIGIDPEDQDRIFEVFQRLHSQEEHAGTGIGLALCKRIVERHGGDIWVESEPGEGATFSFNLPAAGGVDADE